MKPFLYLLILVTFLGSCTENHLIYIETESFENPGGWVIDQQFMDVMGSPFLMAHGMGVPVADASTEFEVKRGGSYQVFVRTRNWNAAWSPGHPAGQFRMEINGTKLEPVFGTSRPEWSWVQGGTVVLKAGKQTLSLHDLTGFNGRCDAILLSGDPDFIPPDDPDELKEFRRKALGLKKQPEKAGEFDFVVVGGGIAGTCAAISAARLGLQVALIQNRPVLGGNNSSEVRVHLGARINLEPWPNLGNLVNEIGPDRGGNAQPASFYEDDKKLQAVRAEENISLFLNYHANEVQVVGGSIRAVVAESIETGERLYFEAPLFADCTGDGTIGVLAGAEYMEGRESRSVYGEPTAPEEADNLIMGASVQWFSETRETERPFPDIPWGLPWNEAKAEAITRGDWNWETGMGKDMVKDFEQIRDYGMLVVFSNWSFLKNHAEVRDRFTNEELQWVAWVAGKRESRRLKGDYVLIEQDLTEHRLYADGTAPASWTIDLHYPDPANSALFPGGEFKSIARHIPIYPYPIPFRCLYSANIDNLMMAGRNISVSHVALGTTRLMRTCGMMGEVLGMAASICQKENTTPRGVYQDHFDKLEVRMNQGIGNPNLPNKQTYNLGNTLQ